MSQRPIYFLAPEFTFRPETGPIRLGSIILDPLRPHHTLSSVDNLELETCYPRIERIVETERTISRTASHDIGLAVWAQALQAVGLRVSGEKSTTKSAVYTTEALTTVYFAEDPSPDEIKKRIADSRTRDVMKGDFISGRQPVYMICGLKIAHGLAGRKEWGKNHGVSMESTPIVPVATGAVDLGAGVNYWISDGNQDTWNTADSIVFAYRLLKIEWKGWKNKRLQVDEFEHKQQFLSRNDSDRAEEDSSMDESDDETGDDLGIESVATSDMEEAQAVGVTLTGTDGAGLCITLVEG